ncbi:MAG: hypothetical protein ACFB0E_08910 [Leptolyngbyaceae cyanobacterium]
MEDQQKATKVTLYLTSDLHRQLKIRSAVDGEPMSSLAQKALHFYLSHSDVVEEHVNHGGTYRTYSCPSCGDTVVVREGELVLAKDVISSVSRDDKLNVDMSDMISDNSRPEEGQLVHC